MWTPILTETRHHFSREQLHRAANLFLWQAAEVHPAEHLADSHGAHRLDVARDGVRRPEGDGLADEIVPIDLREALGLGAEAGLETRMRVLDSLGDLEPAERFLVPHLGVLGLLERLPVRVRDVDVARQSGI